MTPTRPDLTLTGAIPGLLRRGSPVRVSLASDAVILGCYLFGRVVCQDGGLMDWYDIGEGSEDVAPNEVALDLTDPTGRYHALLWLHERGCDLRWAENEANVLAWLVLSVARGGEPIVGILAQRCFGNAGCPPGTTLYYLEREGDNAKAFYANVTRKTDERPAKIAEALAARYALRNPDGSLTLPEFSKVTT